MKKLNYNGVIFLLAIVIFSFAFFANGNQTYAAGGSISCSSVTSDSVKLQYNYTSPDSRIEIRRGSVLITTLSSGTRSGYYTNTGLNSNTTYTYYLRTTNGQTLDTATCTTSGGTTPVPTNPSGSLSCSYTTDSSVQLNYNYSNTTSNVEIWNGQSRIATLLSGNRSGSYTNTGLAQNSTYTYYLRHSGQTLDTATCTTSGGGVTPTPTCDSPIASTYHASSVTTHSAVLNGYVEPYGEYTHYWFEYGTSSSNLNNSTSKQTTYSSTNFDRSISGLSDNTTYYFRAVAQSDCGIDYGQVLHFRTGSDYYYQGDSLTIQKLVKSADRNTEWSDSVTVAPGELVSFYIRVESDGYMSDVIVRDVLPNGLVYAGGLAIDNIVTTGDITQGINIGDVSEGQNKVVVFNARVAGEQSFGIGSTNLVNTAFVSSGSRSINDTAKVFVVRGIVAGVATHIATGITDNKLIDFIILPLLATILIFILFRKYISILVEWLERKRENILDSRARKKLEKVRRNTKIS